VKLHALVDDLETARLAVEGGATVVQWRLKNVSRLDVVERGRATRSLCARHGITFVVNDDIEAALMLGADGVHLGRTDEGAARARDHGLLLGLSASTLEEARAADSEADYIGVGPIWETPS
jgi:thiamine-phosphate pyrophosphorylase